MSLIPYSILEAKGSDTIYVSFNGRLLHKECPNFYNVLPKDVSRIFLVDMRRAWYHFGVRGISMDIPSTARWIEQAVSPYKNVVYTVVSMGAYAALLFAGINRRGHVVAFSPQTFLSPDLMRKYNSNKYREALEKMIEKIEGEDRYLDINEVLQGLKSNQKIIIYAPRRNHDDMLYIQHLMQSPNISTCLLDTDEHNTAGFLKKQGKLLSALTEPLPHIFPKR